MDMQDEEAMPSAIEQLEVRRALGEKYIDTPDVDAEWQKLKGTLPVDAASSEKPLHARIYILSVAIAAAVAALVVMVFTMRRSTPTTVFTADNNNAKDIIVTGNNIVRKVAESSTPIAFNPPTSYKRKYANVEEMSVSTPRGKTCQLTLPDGTRVWLNAGSKITFPDRFTGSNRNVKVQGEAYFEVVKDPSKPFTVSTDWFTTTVHGTVFDLCAYSAADASVALVSGSVAVSIPGGHEDMLSPGQQATVSDGSIDIKDVDTYALTQWKDGFFYFDNARLADIMVSIGRWYNVSVVFEHEPDMERRLHFVAGHDETLHDIVARLNAMGIVRCTLDGDVVSVE